MSMSKLPLTHDQMIALGASGSLQKAWLRWVPIEKIDGLEPAPQCAGEDPYQIGRAVEQPVEVEHDPATGKFILYAGNHRFWQTFMDRRTHIAAFVQPQAGNHASLEAVQSLAANDPGGHFSPVQCVMDMLSNDESSTNEDLVEHMHHELYLREDVARDLVALRQKFLTGGVFDEGDHEDAVRAVLRQHTVHFDVHAAEVAFQARVARDVLLAEPGM